MMQKKAPKLFFQDKLKLLLLVVLGTLSWAITMVKSGIVYNYGMGFWGPNGHDGVWHVALAQSFARGSFDMPTFSGVKLQNYHVGYDFLLALVNKITAVPIHNLYFQIFPVLIGVAVGVLTFLFVYKWKSSLQQSLWAVFFVYFGGSLGWVVTFLRDGEFGGESLFWSQQSISTLINPPFALSLLIILIGMRLLLNKKTPTTIVFSILCFGILIEMKAYAGIIGLVGLFTGGIFEFWKKKTVNYIVIFFGSLVMSITLLAALSGLNSSILVWQPFWFLETMMGYSDRFSWPKLYEAMVNYKSGNSIKFFPAYGLAFVIFWFGNIGTRVIKEFEVLRWIKNYKTIGFWEVFFSSTILFGILMPMLFLQKGTPWNTIQFIYYSLFFSGILAGVATGTITEKLKGFKKLVISFTVVLFTLPTTVSTFKHYLPERPPAKISHEELNALKYLSNMPVGIVLTYPFDKSKADAAVDNPPRPLYLYESTAYVSAFSNKPVFIEDQVNLDITGYDWKLRREQVVGFLESKDKTLARSFLKSNDISYIYWVKGQRALLSETELGIKRIYENSEVDIYEVQ